MARATGRRVIRFGAVVLLAMGVAACAASPAPQPATGPRYVALGDSWISGPLVPDISGQPLDCGRSTQNSPSVIARELGFQRFVDASCGGAKTDDLTKSQRTTLRGLFGTTPPQLDALTADTTLVTIGIGGNDINFSSTALKCVNLLPFPLGPPPFGQPCVERLTASGVDQVAAKIAATRPKIDEALAAIRQRAPRAAIYLIGYPTALPDTGPGCWPTAPILEPDVRYLRDKFKEMNRMLQDAATAARVHFVDTYTSSIGHDICQPVGTAWVNGATLEPMALPMHPNAMSHANTARLVVEAVRNRR